MASTAQPVGNLIRAWRPRRRLSQLGLALGADVSARHVSFVETGRSLPSREMLLHLAEWRAHLLARLGHQVDVSADPVLVELLEELRAYPLPDRPGIQGAPEPDHAGVFVPLRLVIPPGTLNLISTTTVFGTPVDVTLSELALETFFPADAATAALLRGLAEAQP